MRTDVKVGLVAVLVVVLLVITYFAFSHHSSKISSEGVLPSQQPGLMPATDNTSGASGGAAPVANNNPASTGAAGGTASAVIPPAGTQPAVGTQAAPGLVQVAPTTGPDLTGAVGSGTGQTGSMAATTNSDNSGGTLADNTAASSSSANGSAGNAGTNSGVAVPDNSSGSVNTGNSDTGAAAGASGGNSQSLGGANAPGNGSSNSGTGVLPSGTKSRHHHGRMGRHSTLSSREYRVRKGDTLARISVHIYGSARMIRALERANPGLDPRRMHVGQVIHLPQASHVRSVVHAHARNYRKSVSRHTAGYSVHGRTYVVRSGDSLRSLARRFYRTSAYWKLIYRANQRKIGSNPNNIRVGEKLVIPAH